MSAIDLVGKYGYLTFGPEWEKTFYGAIIASDEHEVTLQVTYNDSESYHVLMVPWEEVVGFREAP